MIRTLVWMLMLYAAIGVLCFAFGWRGLLVFLAMTLMVASHAIAMSGHQA